MNVSTILEKIAIEVPLEKPNWERERKFLLQKPVFLKEKAQELLKNEDSKGIQKTKESFSFCTESENETES